MENFILWSASFQAKIFELSFFATPVHIKRINKGTQEMIKQMLTDLGIPEIAFDEWTVDHFLTNYLVDYPLSDNWQDIWSDTWEIKVKLAESVKLEIQNTDLIRTYARDLTWKGEKLSLPSKCILVADFYSPSTLAQGKKILDKVGDLIENTSLIDELNSLVPDVPKEIFIKLRQTYLYQESLQDKSNLKLEIHPILGLPKQLILSLGILDEQFFINGAKLAQAIADLVYELDGTTTWNETTDPYQYS